MNPAPRAFLPRFLLACGAVFLLVVFLRVLLFLALLFLTGAFLLGAMATVHGARRRSRQ